MTVQSPQIIREPVRTYIQQRFDPRQCDISFCPACGSQITESCDDSAIYDGYECTNPQCQKRWEIRQT